jgi:hypothetical protein
MYIVGVSTNLLCQGINTYVISRFRSDDPHIFKDAPVGLQLVGRSHEEEAVLAMTEVVENALKRASSVPS